MKRNEVTITMMRAFFPGLLGVGSNENTGDAAKESMGEQLERFALYKSTARTLDHLTAFEFLKMKNETVPYKYVRMANNDRQFLDSTGAGSGSFSTYAIEHGFLEFVERQSFVYTFLTKNSGQCIDEKIVKRTDVDYQSLLRDYDSVSFRGGQKFISSHQ